MLRSDAQKRVGWSLGTSSPARPDVGLTDTHASVERRLARRRRDGEERGATGVKGVATYSAKKKGVQLWSDRLGMIRLRI